MATADYNGVQKAAILLITLGPERSADIFKHLKEEEIEELTLEIANTRSVSPQVKEDILNEFYQVCLAQQYIAEGGIGYAKELLDKALGQEKAQEVISKLTASLQVRPFEFVRKTDPSQLLNFIQDEHPQTIAMILSYLTAAQAAMVLGALPPEKQADVAKRIAMMDRTSPDVIKEVERVLERRLSSLVNQDYTIVGGVDAIVNILNTVDRSTEKHIMESLEIEEPELADEIRKKMFVFEDILLLDDRAIQRVLRDVENSDLGIALKGANEDVQNAIFNNLSKRLAAMIKEDMEFMGPVRMKDVEEAQQKIVSVIRKLEDAGEIVISRGGGDEIIALSKLPGFCHPLMIGVTYKLINFFILCILHFLFKNFKRLLFQSLMRLSFHHDFIEFQPGSLYIFFCDMHIHHLAALHRFHGIYCPLAFFDLRYINGSIHQISRLAFITCLAYHDLLEFSLFIHEFCICNSICNLRLAFHFFFYI